MIEVDGIERMLDTAVSASLKAGRIAKRYREHDLLQISRKADTTVVTRADMDAELDVRGTVNHDFPDHAFHGEEFPDYPGGSNTPFRWNCDPIDGTDPYSRDLHNCCVSLSLSYKGSTIIGVLYNPFTSELYTASEKTGAKLGSRDLPVRLDEKLEDAMINIDITKTEHDQTFKILKMAEARKFKRLQMVSGSIAYNLAMIAKGSHGLLVCRFWRPLAEHDYSAAAYIVRKMGGKVTGIDGIDYEHTKDDLILVAAPSAKLHEQGMGMLDSIRFCR